MEKDRKRMSKAMRWYVATELAADRLEYININVSKVNVKNTFYTRFGKRIIDILLSSLILIVTLPLNLVIGIITFFDVGRPLFFRQLRTGRNGKPFYIIKFRNMRNTEDENGELLPASQRVTTWGKFVRKTSLDELLNFVSILKGDMSLIGPRPLPTEYYVRYNKKHMERLAVRPGLECPPRKHLNYIRTWHEQFENDIWYVENVSLKTDIMMCIRLVQFALCRNRLEYQSGEIRGTFMGYDLEGKAINIEGVPQEYIDRAFERTCFHKIDNINLDTKVETISDVIAVGKIIGIK